MRRSRFQVTARLDGRPATATVTITRDSGLVSVRPYRRRHEYTLPLATVAEMVYARVVKAELAERKAAKARRAR